MRTVYQIPSHMKVPLDVGAYGVAETEGSWGSLPNEIQFAGGGMVGIEVLPLLAGSVTPNGTYDQRCGMTMCPSLQHLGGGKPKTVKHGDLTNTPIQAETQSARQQSLIRALEAAAEYRDLCWLEGGFA